MTNILVTGAGAVLGQGIIRLLQVSSFDKRIFTTDPDPRSTGHYLSDYALTVPVAKDPNYIARIEEIVQTHQIDFICVGTDVELPIFAKYKERFYSKFNCRVIVSSEDVVEIANDKFLTAEFLRNHGFPYPYSVMANNKAKLLEISEKLGFPLFAKPVDGARSKGLTKVDNLEELMALYSPDSKLVVQQYLPDDLGEFTTGCTVINGKCKAIVTLRRDLKDGNTYRAFVDQDTSKYDQTIKKIAEALKPDGPVNFQFRVVDDQPVVFEINGRYSGTTPLRHFFGYNEVEALLKYYLLDEEIVMPKLREGMVMRMWADLFVDKEQLKDFDKAKQFEGLRPEFFNFSLIE